MNQSEQRKKLITETLDVLGSFAKAVRLAGGDVSPYLLMSMSVVELIQIMAPNKIRFIYQGGDNAITPGL